MWRFLGRVWRVVREHLGHWAAGGAVVAVTGTAPEEWFSWLFEKLHVSGYVARFWSAGWDIRVIPMAIGVLMIAGDIIWHRRQQRPEIESPVQPAPPVPPPVTVNVNINNPGPAQVITREPAAPAAHPGDKPIALPYPSLGPLFKGRDAFLRRLHASLTRPDVTAARHH